MLYEPAQLKAAAEEKGLSVPELCERARVHKSTFNKWLAGDSEPTIRILRKLNEALETESA